MDELSTHARTDSFWVELPFISEDDIRQINWGWGGCTVEGQGRGFWGWWLTGGGASEAGPLHVSCTWKGGVWSCTKITELGDSSHLPFVNFLYNKRFFFHIYYWMKLFFTFTVSLRSRFAACKYVYYRRKPVWASSSSPSAASSSCRFLLLKCCVSRPDAGQRLWINSVLPERRVGPLRPWCEFSIFFWFFNPAFGLQASWAFVLSPAVMYIQLLSGPNSADLYS